MSYLPTKHALASPLGFNLMMAVCIIVWAFAFPFIQIALTDLSFVNLTILRLTIVCLSFSILYGIRRSKFTKIQKKDIVPIFLLGFFGVIVYHLGLNYGEQLISAGAASLIIASIPIFIVLYSIFLLREIPPKKKIFGIILALLGVLVISLFGTENAAIEIEYIFGAIAVIIAAIVGAAYTIAGKKLLERYSPLSLTFYAMLLGTIGLVPLLNISFFQEVQNMSLMSWGAVLFLGFCSTVVGYVLWYIALEIKNATEISVYLYAIPVLSTIISYILFDTKITLLFIAGGVLVIAGVYLVNNKPNKQKET